MDAFLLLNSFLLKYKIDYINLRVTAIIPIFDAW